jgi:hypothetical protein
MAEVTSEDRAVARDVMMKFADAIQRWDRALEAKCIEQVAKMIAEVRLGRDALAQVTGERAKAAADLVTMQQHRDAWRRYAYGRGERPADADVGRRDGRGRAARAAGVRRNGTDLPHAGGARRYAQRGVGEGAGEVAARADAMTPAITNADVARALGWKIVGTTEGAAIHPGQPIWRDHEGGEYVACEPCGDDGPQPFTRDDALALRVLVPHLRRLGYFLTIEWFSENGVEIVRVHAWLEADPTADGIPHRDGPTLAATLAAVVVAVADGGRGRG